MLIEPLTEQQLNTVYSELLSPLAWDLGHIANFEELWLVQRIGGRAPLDGELGRFYDAIENPRSSRNELPLLRGEQLRRYMADVRARALDVLESVELDSGDPLLADGFAYEMLIAHEQQHNETMLQLLQMIDGYPCPGREPEHPAPPVAGPEMVALEGGTYTVGAESPGFAYDNERPAHEVEVGPFQIDRTPVRNSEFARFLAESGAEPPLYWERDGEGGWLSTAFGQRRPLLGDAPVIHVSWEQARDFALWAGKRLPTETEWEIAAAGSDPEAANLDQLGYGCRVAGDDPKAAADSGALQMLGDVWEWTASDFRGYPGFEPFPYPEYSQVFFSSDYKVLRGGSWATRRSLIRTTFRNWDHPVRRQIFAGFRCARDG
jgi:gamma-glutamyl hercynylcysteine S-oxide synthase